MEKFIITHQWLILLLILWTIPWKGVALWKAARNSHKIWFIVLFLFNTLAILEILYIFIFGKRKKDRVSYIEFPLMPIEKKEKTIQLIKGL